MLNKDDIDFLIKTLDNTNITGIKASMKLNEVFIKLTTLAKEIEDGKQEVVQE